MTVYDIHIFKYKFKFECLLSPYKKKKRKPNPCVEFQTSMKLKIYICSKMEA